MAKQIVVFLFFMVAAAMCLSVQAESAEAPLDSSMASCIKDNLSLGLCFHKEILSYISTRKLDFSACCKFVDGIAADCFPSVTSDPIFGLIYKNFCPAP